MASYNKGDVVVATKDIGGFLREHVPKGSKGTVEETSFFGGTPTRVRFRVEGSWSSKHVEISVEPGEVL